MRTWILGFLLVLLVLAAAGGGFFLGYDRGQRAGTSAEQEALELEFERSMTGVVLEGAFTVDGRPSDEFYVERYTVERIERLTGDVWVFHARIQYGEHDVTVPVPVRVLWAGDTPVISLSEVAVPGLGTFSARVVFYDDHYAGMWSNPETGGHQFGVLLRDGGETPSSEASP